MNAPLDVLLVAGDSRGSRVAGAVLAAHAPRVRSYAVHGLAAVAAYGEGRAPFAQAPAPRLVLLDLDRDAAEGHAMLAALRGSPRCRHVPVVAFGAPAVREAYAQGASCCVAPSGDRRDLATGLGDTLRFWCDVAALPSAPGAARAAVARDAAPGPPAAVDGRGPGRPLDLLLVEDNPGDVLLTTEALAQAGRSHHLHVAGDGAAALRFLRREAPHADAPRPDLVLLDLNLPGMHGRDVLARIKADADLRATPVLVLTSSAAAADVDACYALQANCYVRKPDDFRQLERAVLDIERFWCQLAALPSGRGGSAPGRHPPAAVTGG